MSSSGVDGNALVHRNTLILKQRKGPIIADKDESLCSLCSLLWSKPIGRKNLCYLLQSIKGRSLALQREFHDLGGAGVFHLLSFPLFSLSSFLSPTINLDLSLPSLYSSQFPPPDPLLFCFPSEEKKEVPIIPTEHDIMRCNKAGQGNPVRRNGSPELVKESEIARLPLWGVPQNHKGKENSKYAETYIKPMQALWLLLQFMWSLLNPA